MTYVVIAIVVLIVLIVLWLILTFNSLIRLRNEVQQGASSIDVQLKRRADLIPNLVEAVKGYAQHETAAFESVTRARAALDGLEGGDRIRGLARTDLRHAQAQLGFLGVLQAALGDTLLDETDALVGLVHGGVGPAQVDQAGAGLGLG